MGNGNSLSVTVDVEDWYHIPSVCGSTFSVYKDVDDFFDNWEYRYDYLTEPTKRVLDILDEFNVNATFFVVADIAEHYPGLIESIAERGHEIACHGLHHACKIDPKTKQPLMSADEFEKRTIEARNILEKISGQKVTGYRAPNALIGGWMVDSLEKIGFKYDSSVCVNSLYNKTDSTLEGVSTYPYYPVKGSLEMGSKRGIVEYPWAYYEFASFKVPTSGGPMLRFLGAHMMLKGLKQSLKRGNTVFYFHPIDLSYEKFPQIGKGRPMYWAIKGNVVEKRLRYILNKINNENINVSTMSDLE
ncbi:polysaccharide deacetylase family protein [Methanolobus tindarius]|uniref:polysaccharide deacetylase family protein n=1 Tax=Methanolobus tindarius TaxID=2221 RepID=UPI000A4D0AEF|nr:polysaccharide deacetylase family protein [Methanolobus tindarius]